VILKTTQSPGDVVMPTAAVRDGEERMKRGCFMRRLITPPADGARIKNKGTGRE